jgi:retron-type reverse transcriptase
MRKLSADFNIANYKQGIWKRGVSSIVSLLSRYQSGFRPKHSTLSALIQMCDEWLQNMDNGNLNCVVFLDVRKAFDSINHEILLQKMHDHFGINGLNLT